MAIGQRSAGVKGTFLINCSTDLATFILEFLNLGCKIKRGKPPILHIKIHLLVSVHTKPIVFMSSLSLEDYCSIMKLEAWSYKHMGRPEGDTIKLHYGKYVSN